MKKQRVFARGAVDAIPIGLGYLAVSFTFGLKARQLGLQPWVAGVMSLTNLTSAGQFAGASLIAAGAGVLELVLAQLVINARYFLMSASLSQRLWPDLPFLTRAVMGFGVTDEIFALSASRPAPLPPAYHLGAMALCIPSWTAGTLMGAALGSVLPTHVMNALGIALYGMLMAAIIPAGRQDKGIRSLIVYSMLVSAFAAYVPPLSAIPGGLRIVLLTVVLTTWAALKRPVKEAAA